MPELCLGTVQFGLHYGITNASGQVGDDEVRRILRLAAASGIELLDTAQAYGTSEAVLGRCWPSASPRRLISKLSPDASPESWERRFQSSLELLHVSTLDGFLLHRASALSESDGDQLIDWLESLLARGLVKRIGVSIYDASELDGLPLHRLQLIQLPLSLYDQRLLQDGTVSQLKSVGIAIHARSLFLQGLLLQAPEAWPAFLSQGFREHHAQCMGQLRHHGLTFLDAAIGFARQCQDLEAVLVGVLNTQELTQILQAWQQGWPAGLKPMSQWSWDNTADLDPRCWPVR
jgi:aryl-alcohol dehydrogenase-like predicted oxidoreductase